MKPSLDFCVFDLSLKGAKVDVGSKGVHNDQISAVSSNGAEKSETRIDTLKRDDVVHDSSPITLS